MANTIFVMVAYAVADNQKVLSVELPENSTVSQQFSVQVFCRCSMKLILIR